MMDSESKKPVLESIKYKGFTFQKVPSDDFLPEIPTFLYGDGKQNALNECRQENQLLNERQEAPLRSGQKLPHEKQETSMHFAQDSKTLQNSSKVSTVTPKTKQTPAFDQNASKPVQNAPSFQASKSAQKALTIQTPKLPTQAVPSAGYHTPQATKSIPALVSSISKQMPIVCSSVGQRLSRPLVDPMQTPVVIQKRELLTKPNNFEPKKPRIVQSSKNNAFDLMKDFNKNDKSKQSNVGSLDDFDDNEAKQWQFGVKSKVDNNKQSNAFDNLNDFDENEAMQWQFELAKSPNANPSHQVLTSSRIYPSVSKPNVGQENVLSNLHVQQKLSSGNDISHQRMPPTNQQKPLVSTPVGQQKPLASTLVGQQKTPAASIGQQKPLASTPVGQQKPLESTSVGQNSANAPLDAPSPKVQPQVLQSSNVKFDLKGKFKSFLKDDTKRFQNDSLLPNDLRTRMYHTLRNVFGFRTFRFCQQSVIIASLLGNSCCVLMPTGAGKSLCYQLTALLLDGLTVVVSPLISLMNDQVAKMKCLKIFAASLHSDITKETRDAIFADLNGDVNLKLLYVTPEMLAKSTLLLDILKDVHRRGKLNRIVIDEAHCISSWGHDFRTDYSNLPTYFKVFQGVPLMALIAAATPQTVIDIRQNLDIQKSAFFISSFVRSNISYEIMPKNAVNTKQLVKYLKTHYSESSGIFYCLSGQDCDKIAAMLNQAGLSAVSYYGSMDDNDRENAQNRWMQGEINVICATIAFGMGIDKPDVRYVIHHSMPPSIENYYQETGRAGRDNLPSQCILLYSFADHVRYLKLFEETKRNPVHKAQRIKNLYKMIEYCENVTDCHQKLLIEHFGEFYDPRNCLQSQTQCHICNTQLASNYKAYDFTDEAVEVLKSIDILNKGKDSKATMKKVIDLYRGIEKKTKGSNTNSKLPLFKRGEGCDEEGVKRFVRKLLTDGYLSEFLEFSTFIKFDVCYIKLTKKGEEFVIKKKPKFYSYLSAPSKNTTTAHLNAMPIVSETAILKEKYKLKYIHVFYGALSELKTLMIQILRKETGKAGNPYNIISAKGIEQMAAMLPRTESEFFNIDSMSPDKYKTYAPRIMPIMQKYWAKIDRYENANVQQAVRQC